MAWPLVSFAVVALPFLLSWDLNIKNPPPQVRQQLALLFCLSLLFSSWFQFYFRIQTWVQDYPSLVADSVDSSAFVYRVPGQTVALSAGVTHLSVAEAMLKDEVDGKPWPAVERWLLNLEGQRAAMQQQVRRQMGLNPSLEDSLWRLDFQPLTNGNGYILKLWAIWSGPAAESGYYLEKSCLLMPVSRGGGPLADRPLAGDPGQAAPPPPSYGETQWATLTCNLETPRQAGHPRGAQRS